MQLNDPFGRVSRRRQQAYAVLRAQLEAQGIKDNAGIQAFATDTRKTALRLAALVIGVALLFGVLFPNAIGVITVVGGLILVWLFTSYLQTRMLLRRYRNEQAPDS